MQTNHTVFFKDPNSHCNPATEKTAFKTAFNKQLNNAENQQIQCNKSSIICKKNTKNESTALITNNKEKNKYLKKILNSNLANVQNALESSNMNHRACTII